MPGPAAPVEPDGLLQRAIRSSSSNCSFWTFRMADSLPLIVQGRTSHEIASTKRMIEIMT